MKSKEGESYPAQKRQRKSENDPPSLPNETIQSRPKSRLVCLLKRTYSSICPPPQHSQFVFKNTEEAVIKNSALIMSFDGNVSAVLDNKKGSTLTPGSEFRNEEFINPLFDLHEDGEKLKEIIEKGASYIFKDGTEQTEDERRSDIIAAVEKGNNHSARGKESLLKTRYTKKSKEEG